METSLENKEPARGMRLTLTKRDDGIYLSVREEKLLVYIKPEQLSAELLRRKIPHDATAVKEIYADNLGLERKIAELHAQMEDKPLLLVRMSQDQMKAYLILIPFLNGTKITAQDIERVLQDQKIIYGIKKEIIPLIPGEQDRYNEWLIAEGLPVIPGINAALIYYFNTQNIEIKPQELSDGSVDFHDLNLIQTVEEDALLVEKTPPQPGKSGMTVLGEERKALQGKDIRLPGGQNTKAAENGGKLLAAKAGHIVYANKKVNIYSSYEVKGDVDFNIGNIHFPGTVMVYGNVKTSFKVEATGDVVIYGNLEGMVKTDGNLQVKKGIVRGQAAVLGNIYARYIENSSVESKENIIVTEAIMHSTTTAARKVIVGGRKGLLVGGKCCAGEEIQARNIGSALGTVTTLEVGISPEIREEFKSLNKKLLELRDSYNKNDKILKTLQEIKQKYGELDNNKKDILLKSSRSQYHMSQEMAELDERRSELEALFANMEKAKVSVQETVYSGVTIFMGKATHTVPDEMKTVIFILEDHEIKYVTM
ncbi:MAG: FapA family protein [Clostridia bacterium]|nr:FapA family protein [Clostridia bacterium]